MQVTLGLFVIWTRGDAGKGMPVDLWAGVAGRMFLFKLSTVTVHAY